MNKVERMKKDIQYGDYGTSPRSGWLEMQNKDSIIKFIDKITITGQEHEYE